MYPGVTLTHATHQYVNSQLLHLSQGKQEDQPTNGPHTTTKNLEVDVKEKRMHMGVKDTYISLCCGTWTAEIIADHWRPQILTSAVEHGRPQPYKNTCVRKNYFREY